MTFLEYSSRSFIAIHFIILNLTQCFFTPCFHLPLIRGTISFIPRVSKEVFLYYFQTCFKLQNGIYFHKTIIETLNRNLTQDQNKRKRMMYLWPRYSVESPRNKSLKDYILYILYYTHTYAHTLPHTNVGR